MGKCLWRGWCLFSDGDGYIGGVLLTFSVFLCKFEKQKEIMRKQALFGKIVFEETGPLTV